MAGLHQNLVDATRKLVAEWPEAPSILDTEMALRLLAKGRSQLLANTYLQKHGPYVWGGLFAGMRYLEKPNEGSYLARLLGAYEAALQTEIAAIAEDGLDRVIDVGCAEGYYAVGLARRWPDLAVDAFDISEAARARCAELAALNGVSDRVRIAGEFRPEGFEAYAGQRVLVIVDAEGAEVDILRPDLSPALAEMSIVVETHDVWRPGALQTLVERFTPTHEIKRIDQSFEPMRLPDWFSTLSELDQLLAHWEWRHRPTPWLVMRPR